MSPNSTKNEKQVQFYDGPSSKHIQNQLVSPITGRIVQRSSSAITQNTKISSSKLRRHAKSEPISTNKESLTAPSSSIITSGGSINGPDLSVYPSSHVTSVTSNVSNVTGTGTSTQQNHNGVKYKRPTFLPIKTSPSLSIPTATPSTDLPGSSSHRDSVHEENRKLRYRIMQLEKRESQFTAALDKLQKDYTDMTETCQRRFEIEERKVAAMEYAMKQLAIENEKLKRENVRERDNVRENARENDTSVKRESPNVEYQSHNSWQSSSSSKSTSNITSNNPATSPNQQMQFESYSRLVNAVRERDIELNMLKMHFLKVEQRQKQVAQHILSPTNSMFTFPDFSKEIPHFNPSSSTSEPNLNVPSGVITPPADFTPPLSHLNEYQLPIFSKDNEIYNSELEPPHEYK